MNYNLYKEKLWLERIDLIQGLLYDPPSVNTTWHIEKGEELIDNMYMIYDILYQDDPYILTDEFEDLLEEADEQYECLLMVLAEEIWMKEDDIVVDEMRLN